jgi:hypothetical protein
MKSSHGSGFGSRTKYALTPKKFPQKPLAIDFSLVSCLMAKKPDWILLGGSVLMLYAGKRWTPVVACCDRLHDN